MRIQKWHVSGRGIMKAIGIGLIVILINAGLLVSTQAIPKRGGTLRITIPTDLTQIDIHKINAGIDNQVLVMTVYETLLTYDEKTNIRPFLCESYKFSQDGLTLTLNLKKGVKFHNGEEMKAEDVKFSLDRCRDPKLPGIHMDDLKPIMEVKITGPYQVQIVLSKPMANLINLLANCVIRAIAIMPRKAIEASGNKVVKPIGTGPYQFASWERDNKITLKRFEAYSSADGPINGLLGKRHAYFDEIIYYVMKEDATRIMALDRGDVDMVTWVPYMQLDDLKKRKDLNIFKGVAPQSSHYLFFLNFNHPLLSKLEFRKALAYALDRNEITKVALWGCGKPSFSIIWPTSQGYSPEIEKLAPSYDPTKAKEFLKKSGYNGETIGILTSKQYSMYYDQAVAAQAMWNSVGIKTKIEIVDWATHMVRWKQGQHDILSFSMIGRLDPIAQAWVLGPNNYYGYKNQEVFSLIKAMEGTLDQEKINEYYGKIYEITTKDIPFLINFYREDTFAIKAYIKGFDKFDIFKTRVWNLYSDK
jgi:peptide/nickel transport system substrate-binding protein